MKHSIEELQKAANIIQDNCSYYFDNCSCNDCPFSVNHYICGLVGDVNNSETMERRPGQWKISPMYKIKLIDQSKN